MSPGITTGVGGASLDWDRRRRVTPVQTASQEAWPEAEPLGWNTPLGESRGGTPSSVRAPKGRAPHRKMRRLVTLRLPAFRFLHFIGLTGRNRNNGRPKGRPHPCPFLGPNRFSASRDDIFAGARNILYRAQKKTRASRRAARTRVFAMKFRRGWLNELPLPRGERVGVRGFGSSRKCSGVRTPSTCPSPLWGEGTQLAGRDIPLAVRQLSRARHNAP